MNILVYRLNNEVKYVLKHLSKIKDVRIYFAVSDKDAFRIVNEIVPDVTLLGNKNIKNKNFIPELKKKNPTLQIFKLLKKEDDYREFCFINQRTNEHISFKNLIETI